MYNVIVKKIKNKEDIRQEFSTRKTT